MLTAVLAYTEDLGPIKLSGQVTGSSGKHTVYVALWDAKSFLQKPVEQVRIEAGGQLNFKFKISPGRWAVSAFEDKNENGILDMGLFGPKEPTGFWRALHAWRKPRFEDVAAQVNSDTSDADIKLK